jgi:hypothetical protein
VPATPVFADAVEEIARASSLRPQPSPAWLILLRPLIYAFVLLGRLPLVERLYWNPKKLVEPLPRFPGRDSGAAGSELGKTYH